MIRIHKLALLTLGVVLLVGGIMFSGREKVPAPRVRKSEQGGLGSSVPNKQVVAASTNSSGALMLGGRAPLIRPQSGDSLEKVQEVKQRIAAGEKFSDSLASRQFPASGPFTLDIGGVPTVMHVALDEVYFPNPSGTPEIVQIPPAADLREWQKRANEISPLAELVLYPPDLPRSIENALMLGTTAIVAAASEEEAQSIAEEGGWQYERPAGDGMTGRYVVSASHPTVNLQALQAQKSKGLSNPQGNFRKVVTPRRIAPGTQAASSSTVSARYIPNDVNFSSQWNFYQPTALTGGAAGVDLNVIDVWDFYNGNGVTIGIIDDGLQLLHPDLSPNLSPVALIHHDWNDSTPNDPSPGSLNPHGTSVAGLAAARGNNTIGVSGVAPNAKLVGLRLIAAPLTELDEIEAFGWKNDVISIKNNSWGPSDDGFNLYMLSDAEQAALASATTNGRNGKGEVFLWANGNGGYYNYSQFVTDSSNYDGYANSIYAIAVAALAADGLPSSYTEKGGNISVTAPSSGPDVNFASTPAITTTDLVGLSGYSTTDYNSVFGGTSAATPQVAGVVALMLEANPTLGWRDVKEILLRTAQKINPSDAAWVVNKAGLSFNPWYGAGLVNAKDAVNLALEWENLAAMRSVSASSSALNLTIPDNKPEGVTVSLPISENFRVESVAVTVSATHQWRGDMVFSVISPGGTQIRLTGGVRYLDSNSNLTNATFTTPFLWGESSAGAWQVKAADEWVGITGKLTSAAIKVYGSDSPVAPSNDNFEKATLLDGSTQSIITSNRGAGREKGEPKHAGERGGGSLWWKIQPRVSGYLTIDTLGSSIDTLMALYQGTSLSSLTLLSANDDISTTTKQSRLARWPVQPGEIYLLAVDGKDRARGNLKLNFNLTGGALFDNFVDAKPVSESSWSDTRSNAGYSAEPGEPAHAGVGAAARSVWYKWTPQVAGTALVDTRGSPLDTRLGVYLGTAVNNLRLVTQNDNDAGRTSSRVSFGVRAGESYYLAIDGKNGTSGNYSVAATLGTNSVPASPTNDAFASPIAISNAPLVHRYSNVNATRQTGEPAGSTSVWYQWTAPISGVVTMTTEGSLFDTTLGAYSGDLVSSVVLLPSVPVSASGAYNDNAFLGVRWSRIRFQTVAGAKYLVRVNGVRGATGRYDLRIFY